MTENALRLVVDQGENSSPRIVEVPPVGAGGLHIHLHVAPQGERQTSAPYRQPAAAEIGRPAGGVRRPLLFGVAGVLIAIVAFDLGARSGAGHARALAAANTSATGLASLAPGAQQQALTPGSLPPALQQQLAQQPTITPPPGAAPSAGAPDPFGLQR